MGKADGDLTCDEAGVGVATSRLIASVPAEVGLIFDLNRQASEIKEIVLIEIDGADLNQRVEDFYLLHEQASNLLERIQLRSAYAREFINRYENSRNSGLAAAAEEALRALETLEAGEADYRPLEQTLEQTYLRIRDIAARSARPADSPDSARPSFIGVGFDQGCLARLSEQLGYQTADRRSRKFNPDHDLLDQKSSLFSSLDQRELAVLGQRKKRVAAVGEIVKPVSSASESGPEPDRARSRAGRVGHQRLTEQARHASKIARELSEQAVALPEFTDKPKPESKSKSGSARPSSVSFDCSDPAQRQTWEQAGDYWLRSNRLISRAIQKHQADLAGSAPTSARAKLALESWYQSESGSKTFAYRRAIDSLDRSASASASTGTGAGRPNSQAESFSIQIEAATAETISRQIDARIISAEQSQEKALSRSAGAVSAPGEGDDAAELAAALATPPSGSNRARSERLGELLTSLTAARELIARFRSNN